MTLLLDIFHLFTVLNLGHELCAIELESHGLALGHVLNRDIVQRLLQKVHILGLEHFL